MNSEPMNHFHTRRFFLLFEPYLQLWYQTIESQAHPEIGAQVTAMIRSQRKVPQEWGKSRPSQVALKLLLSSQLNVEVTYWELDCWQFGSFMRLCWATQGTWTLQQKIYALLLNQNGRTLSLLIPGTDDMPTSPQTWLTPVEVSSQPCWDQFFWVQKHVWIFTPKMFLSQVFAVKYFVTLFVIYTDSLKHFETTYF